VVYTLYRVQLRPGTYKHNDFHLWCNLKKGRDYIGVGVGAIIFNERHEIFLAKRGLKARNEIGRWEFPGGAVEFGETLEIALMREIREEFGFSIKIFRLLDVVDHILPDEHQHWVSPTFLCRIADGTPEIKEPEKCSDFIWMNVADIPAESLTLASRKSLQSLRLFPYESVIFSIAR